MPPTKLEALQLPTFTPEELTSVAHLAGREMIVTVARNLPAINKALSQLGEKPMTHDEFNEILSEFPLPPQTITTVNRNGKT